MAKCGQDTVVYLGSDVVAYWWWELGLPEDQGFLDASHLEVESLGCQSLHESVN